MYKVDDPVRGVRDENAWTAAQAARYPDRLVAFCSLNPISDAALELLRECVGDGRFKGLKLHFGNANIDLTNPDHLRRVRAVFAAANAARLAIVVHARGGDEYDARHARIFVEQLLPAAPDVPVQMAHLWGGAQFAPEALAVYAEAIEAGKPATGRFIFDVSDAAFAARTPELAQLIATRMRQIGMDRMYYGSDAAFDGHADPATSWQTFRKGLPLTDAEFLQIQSNVAPYMDQ
jgi:predicted TIM-barrel fold metal-dependent hydrolase